MIHLFCDQFDRKRNIRVWRNPPSRAEEKITSSCILEKPVGNEFVFIFRAYLICIHKIEGLIKLSIDFPIRVLVTEDMKIFHFYRICSLLLIFSIILLVSKYYWYTQDDIKFWYIEYIDEQSGKAKFHFLEQLFIASELQRTVILPNVGQSQMGMQHPHYFEFYYEKATLSGAFPMISVLNFRLRQSKLKSKTITAALVYILVEGQCAKQPMSWSDVTSELWLELTATYHIETFPTPICFETKYGWQAPIYPRPIIDYFRNSHLKTDMIVSVKISFFFLMDPSQMRISLLQHNRTLIRIAETFARVHRPYVAVHWRMEGARGNGTQCAQVLVNTTRYYSASHAVYFSTDHPFRTELKSASFRNCCRSDYTRGYQYVLESLRPLMFNDLPLHSIGSDPGSLAIVEKLICEYADVFLAGNAPCDRHGSFGREMIKYRQTIARTPWLYWSQPDATYEPHKDYPW